ncbi:MFS transporter [Pseudomonas sp. YY-1]|uniref:MFS transporter n=1 Tax=Pseudomonas sp. YY-1 TaxID=2058659 RepID=UPI000CAED0AB|nr:MULTISPECIES: MFS transporter [Pseudomonas]PKQ43022.1 MFS transporter [Pseudomonas sp. YY-1]
MDALLIIGGLLLMLAGLIWLVMRAFATSLLWGWGSLIPPITLIYIVRHWQRARSAVTLIGLGVIPLVVGLTLLASKDAERLAAIVRLDWLKPEVQAPAELAINLDGELNGQPFRPQQGELIDGVLVLREGLDFFALRELSIRLPQPVEGPVRIDVLPQDSGSLPEVELSWLLPEQDLPEARRLSRGYTLHLDLQPQEPNRLVGDFHLVLPPRFKTSLSGRVELYRDRLRYVDGQVDARFDSRDTIAHVLQDYLQRRFATRKVSELKLPVFTFEGDSLELQVEAQIDGRSERLPVRLHKRAEQGWAVEGDRFPALPATATAQATPQREAAPIEERLSRPVDRRQRFSLARLQRNPEQYRNLSMRLSRASGGTVEGRFVGVDADGSIRLIQQMGSGGGQASFSFKPEEIGRLQLLEP